MSVKIVNPRQCVHPAIVRAGLRKRPRNRIVVSKAVRKRMQRVRCMIQVKVDRTLPHPAPRYRYHAKTIIYHPTKGSRFTA